MPPEVPVAQVAQGHAANVNMAFKRLRNPRHVPETRAAAAFSAFLPVKIIDHVEADDLVMANDPARPQELIELAGGHRIRITGTYDPDALAPLIRGLTA